MVGEVLEKKRAREIYDSYKQKRQDPGLLEQVDYKTFEMRIFPIAPNAEQKVQITYYQELDFDHDWATYVYPLATATKQGADSRMNGKFAFSLDGKVGQCRSRQWKAPATRMTSSSRKHDESYYQASLETKEGSLARDIVLATNLSRPQNRHRPDHLEARRRGRLFLPDADGRRRLWRSESEGMDYVFVLDISGSMGNDGKLAALEGFASARSSTNSARRTASK